MTAQDKAPAGTEANGKQRLHCNTSAGIDWSRYGSRRRELPDAGAYYRSRLEKLGKPNGTGWTVARCPLHGTDAHPSLSVNLMNGAYCCHTCGAKGGNIAAFEAALTGLSWRDARNALCGGGR
jgi:hypothetical protein